MNIMILGPTRSGKTYLAKRLLHAMSQETEKQIIIFDQQESYATGEFGFDNIRVYGTNILNPSKYMNASFRKMCDNAVKDGFHVLFNVSQLSDDNIRLMLDTWSVYMNRYHNKIYVFEEAYRFMPKRKPSQGLLNVLRNAAKYGNDLIFIFQATQDIDLAIVRQTHFAFVFKLNRDEDQDQIVKSLHIPGELNLEQLNAEQHQCIVADLFDNVYGITNAEKLFSDPNLETELSAFSA